MPKFNEFIKGFEEKAETEQPKVEPAPKTEAPKDNPVAPKGNEQPKVNEPRENPVKYYKPLSKAETEDMKKGGFTEDEYRYKQAKDWAIVMGEEIPDKRKFMQELGEWKEANKQKAEDPNSLEYEGYRLERTPDGKWINRDTYEYFDSKVEAQKDIDKFISSQSPNKPKEPMPFGMKKRMEDEVSVHNGQQPKGVQQMPKKDYSHLDDRELYAQINLAENEEEYNDLLAEKERRWQESKKNQHQAKQGKFEQVFGGGNEPRMLYVVYDTPQGKVGDYIELEPDMSEDDIIEQLKENKNVVGVYGGATNVGAIDPKWVRE